MTHFNKLAPSEDERLALLAEECAEVIQAIAKIQRHGYASHNPHDVRAGTNRETLTSEIGDVIAAVHILMAAGDINPAAVHSSAENKLEDVKRWLHRQPARVLSAALTQAKAPA